MRQALYKFEIRPIQNGFVSGKRNPDHPTALGPRKGSDQTPELCQIITNTVSLRVLVYWVIHDSG